MRQTWRLMLSMLLVAGCGTGAQPVETAISLDEAKQLELDFGAGDFISPKRTIGEIKIRFGTDLSVDPNCELEPLTAKFYDADPVDPISYSKTHQKMAARQTRYYGRTAFMLGNFPKSVELVEHARGLLSGVDQIERATTSMQLARYYATIGDRAKAESLFSASGVLHGDSRDHFDAAQGVLAFISGRYRDSELLFRRTLAPPDVAYGQIEMSIVRYYLVWSVERQGRLDEAESLARDFLLRYALDWHEKAIALESLSRVLLARGRYQDAEWLARKAINLYEHHCIPRKSFFLSLSHLRLAEALLGQEKWSEAVELYEFLAEIAQSEQGAIYRGRLASDPGWGAALLRLERSEEATKQLMLASENLTEQHADESYEAIEIRAFLSLAGLQSEKSCKGLGNLKSSIFRLVDIRDVFGEGAGLSGLREQRLTLLVEGYLSHAVGCLKQKTLIGKPADELFEIAQVGRGGRVQLALSANATRAAAGDPELAELTRKLQDVENKAHELSRIIAYRLSLPSGDVNYDTTRSLQAELLKIQSAASQLAAEVQGRYPKYSRLINSQQVSSEEVRAHMRPNEAVLFVRMTEAESYVWALPAGGDTRFAVLDLGRQAIGEMVAGLRQTVNPSHTVRSLGDVPKFDVDLAHALYKSLLDPVSPGWIEADSLLVVADGELQQLPLSLLVTGPVGLRDVEHPMFAGYREIPWLARSHAVTTLPSMASLTTLRGLPPGSSARRAFAGFGDPVFSSDQATASTVVGDTQATEVTSRGVQTRSLPISLRSSPKTEGFDSADLAMLPRLPDTAKEVSAMALAMNADLTRDIFIGQAANETTIKSLDLSGYRVLAFATHALVPGDLNGLTQPALALTAPEVVGVEGDGLLTMGEILGLKLDADWVVLSACNTAASDGEGAEAVSGLGRAFFYAGARSLLVSNWPVETTSAKALTTDIFRRQADDPTLSRAEALRQAMVALIDDPGFVDGKGRSVFSYARPIFWAPFTLVGDGGTSPQTGS